jgi:hypothetical protein
MRIKGQIEMILRHLRSFFMFAASCAVALSAAGCMSGGGTAAAPVACRLLSPQEISSYAPSRPLNPFVAHGSLLQPAPEEFVVLELDLSLAEPARVAITGAVEDESGAAVAQLWSRTQMHIYWDHLADVTDRDARTRVETLDRYYPPAADFAARRGRTTWILVFEGKSPLPRPATVKVAVSLGGAEAQAFEFPLPPKK